ncbi:MAG: class I SAM-dependent methyltransferase [Paracoccaceae bacterium]|nr:class I SAM-dependent methyltransferase [Paracoccaceae bacterium]MDG2258389.1 class I SAM-dependent methyltransferase [Paracoccaceae bacterium]
MELDAKCCPACGSRKNTFTDYRGILDNSTLEKEIFGELRMVRCSDCGLGFPDQMIDAGALVQFYESEYGSTRQFMNLGEKKFFQQAINRFFVLADAVVGRAITLFDPRGNGADAKRFPSHLKLISEYINFRSDNFKMLEYGAGDARFSKLAKAKYGDDLDIDIIEPSKEWEKEYEDARIVKVGVDSGDLPTGFYDFIHASNVLQHVSDVNADMQGLARSLKPGGIIFVELPCASNNYWNIRMHPNPPYLNFFATKSLSQLARKHGLSEVIVSTFGESDRTANCASMKSNGEFKKFFSQTDFQAWKTKEQLCRAFSPLIQWVLSVEIVLQNTHHQGEHLSEPFIGNRISFCS